MAKLFAVPTSGFEHVFKILFFFISMSHLLLAKKGIRRKNKTLSYQVFHLVITNLRRVIFCPSNLFNFKSKRYVVEKICRYVLF